MAKNTQQRSNSATQAAFGITGDLFAQPKRAARPRNASTPAAGLKKLGIDNPAAWLLICPSRYIDYATETADFANLAVGVPCLVQGNVVGVAYYRTGTKGPLPENEWPDATRLVVTLANGTGDTVDVHVFGRPHRAWRHALVGATLCVRAIPKLNFKAQFELQSAELVPPRRTGTIQPVYPSIRQTKGSLIEQYVNKHIHLLDEAAAIVEHATGWSDPNNPISYASLTSFPSPLEMLRALHCPRNLDEASRAQRASRRVSAFALVRATYTRHADRPIVPRAAIPVDGRLLSDLMKAIPFELTFDQRSAIGAIGRCLAEQTPMHGLLTGDVGTGKTLAYLLPAVAAHLRGARVIIMTPNLPLITALARELHSLFPAIPVATVAGDGIVGDTAKAIIVGSTALIGAARKGKIPGRADFLIVDEQHKFSIEQRASLADAHTNILEATATPVPRTAAIITHGGADVFTLRDRPFRRNVSTRIFTRATGLDARNAVLMSVLHRNEQAAVVYPLVATEDQDKARAAVLHAIDNWKRYIPEERIAVLHGKMKPEEKQAVLDAMRERRCDLLVTSTVIEVGLTFPDLTTMLVVDAERMGVVTLHQLRGRLARHGGAGEMMLYSSAPTPEALARLELLAQNDDGFTLAEKDAEIRGFGDLLGTDGDTQSGKTRTLFLGVEIGPKEIGFAADRYQAAHSLASRQPPNTIDSRPAFDERRAHADGTGDTLEIEDAPRRLSPR